MHRFFIDKKDLDDKKVTISGKDFNHITKSLRLEIGDRIIASIGDGDDLIVELKEFFSDKLTAQMIERKKSYNEPSFAVTVAQAIPKKRNMELVVQKTTEIGVKKIIPLTTKRTVVKLKGKKRKKRIDRWQRIAEEAAKQSQRGIIPEVTDLFTLKSLEDIRGDYDLIITLWASEEDKSLSSLLTKLKKANNLNKILLIIGPEGGFSPDEINLIDNKLGGSTVTLGPRILRTETAGLVGLTAILYELGDLGG